MVRIKLASVANVYVRMMIFEKAGDVENGHDHPYDHTSVLSAGSIKLTVNGEDTVFRDGALIYIQRGLNHRIEALEDNTVLSCVHALRKRDGSGDIIDPASIPKGVHWSEVAAPLIQNRHKKNSVRVLEDLTVAKFER